MFVVFTDLDGTLLDRDTYSFDAAVPALAELGRMGAPVVLVSSKTRAEMEHWRHGIGNCHPFIVENGGAVYVPDGYFPSPPGGTKERDGYRVREFGQPYSELAEVLGEAARATQCTIRSFDQMSAEEVAGVCGLSVETARLAKMREYDGAFQILAGETEALLDEIVSRGKEWTRGGRFFHILSGGGKAGAVAWLAQVYREHNEGMVTIGLGDAPNDVEFLRLVDRPVIVTSELSGVMREMLPNVQVTGEAGCLGWNEAILKMLKEA
jgi:mannosyl-3-phosphoglycerate phosphatase